MNRKYYLYIFVIGLMMCSCQEKEEQPNILYIFADQLRSHELSCYGGENIVTPNMDKLAEQGVRLTNAISTYPICSPYRGMLLTGCYPLNSGISNNDHPLPKNLPSFAEACNVAGYETAYIGKWHIDGHGRDTYIPKDRRLGFKFWKVLECTHQYFKSLYYDNDCETLKQWEGYDAEAQTNAVQDYIRNRKKDSPFFLMLSWGPPHGPYIAPQEYMDRVDASTLKLRGNFSEREFADELLENPRFNIPLFHGKKHRDTKLAQLDSEEHTRLSTKGYLAAIMALDDYLGMLMSTLEKEGILDNTIVVFTSDHGDQLGSHHFYDKNVPFEESISVPFLIKYPGGEAASSVSDAMLSPIDIMPTILGIAGVDCPEIDGVDLSRVLIGKEKEKRDAVLTMNLTHFSNTSLINGLDTWRGLRTKRYTYARYEDQTAWLLFDNLKDPLQLTNLVDDPNYKDLITSFNKQLDVLLKEANDPENTKLIYDRIIDENPARDILLQFRKANPNTL